jgi:hypothetical protein
MAVGEEEGLASAESSISEHEVKCFRLINFYFNDHNLI